MVPAEMNVRLWLIISVIWLLEAAVPLQKETADSPSGALGAAHADMPLQSGTADAGDQVHNHTASPASRSVGPHPRPHPAEPSFHCEPSGDPDTRVQWDCAFLACDMLADAPAGDELLSLFVFRLNRSPCLLTELP